MQRIAIIGLSLFVFLMGTAIYQIYMLRQELQQFRSEVQAVTSTIGNIQQTVKDVTDRLEEWRAYSRQITKSMEDLQELNERLQRFSNALQFMMPNR